MLKSKKIKILFVSVIVVLVAALGTVIGLILYANKPENVTIKAVSGVLEGLVEREEISAAYKMLERGSVFVSVDKIEEDGDDYLDGITFSGKLYFAQDALMGEDLTLAYGGKDLVGSVYLSNEMVYIYEKDILKEGFGVEFSELSNDFKNSIFSSSSESAYALPEEISKLFEENADMDQAQMQENATEIVEKYIKKLYEIFCEHAVFVSENEEVKLGGNKISARVITITIDGDAIINILSDMHKFMEEDSAVTDFLEEYGDTLGSFFELSMVESEDLIDLYGDLLEEFEEVIKEMDDDDMEGALEIEVVTPKRSSELLALNATISLDGHDRELFSLDFGGKEIAEADVIRFESGGGSLVYEVKENDETGYKATLEINDEEYFSVSLDREKQTYEVVVGDGYDSYIIEGTITTSRGTHTITVDKVTESWYSYYWEEVRENVYETEITVVIDEMDPIPDVPENYSRISDITEADVDAWVDRFEELFW